MRPLAARESEMRRRHVGDVVVQIVAADRLHRFRLAADQRKDHREVVRREGPQDVLLAPDLSEVQAVGIDILQPAEPPVRAPAASARGTPGGTAAGGRPSAAGRAARRERRAPSPARLRAPAASRRRRACRPRAPGSPARSEGAAGAAIATASMAGIAQRRLKLRTRPPCLRARAPAVSAVGVDERLECAELGEVADEVLAPVAAADDRDARRCGSLAHAPSRGACSCRPHWGTQALTMCVARKPARAQALRVSMTSRPSSSTRL